MIELGIEVFDLSDEEKSTYHGIMVSVNSALRVIATNHFGSGSPSNVMRLLDDPPENAESWIANINEVAARILGGYIRTVVPLISSCHLITKSKCSVDESDFVQEAILGIYSCMFTFDGRYEFSTWIYSCVKKRLNSYGLQCVRQSSIAAHTKRLKKSECQLRGKGLSSAQAAALVHGVALEEPFYCLDFTDDSPDLRLQAIREADLNKLERYVIEAHRQGLKSRQFTPNFKNPKTGEPFTRQHLYAAFKSGAKKIRAKFEELSEMTTSSKAA